MPLILKKENGSDLVAIWHIQADDKLASGKEYSDLKGIQVIRNRRILQREACFRLVSMFSQNDHEIVYDEFGKPHLSLGTQQVSFSHSGDYAAIMLSSSFAGIDFEQVRPKILNIIHKFMNEMELNSLHPDFQTEHAQVYWGAKEALYKVYGKQELIFKTQILVQPFTYMADNGYINATLLAPDFSRNFRLFYQIIKDHMLVYVVNG